MRSGVLTPEGCPSTVSCDLRDPFGNDSAAGTTTNRAGNGLIIRPIRIRQGTLWRMQIDLHWRSSRLSASSLMCQTATLVIALVALTAGGAHAATATARLHPHTTAASSAQTTRHATHSRRHAAPAHTRTQTEPRTTRKPTPREAGRTAGLAIRRELAQKHPARRDVAFRVEPTRAAFRPQSEGALRSREETRAAAPMEVASASPVVLLPPAHAEEPASAEKLQQPEASARNQPRAATTKRIAPPAPDTEIPDSETPDAETRDAETLDAPPEQASLRVPLHGNPGAAARLPRIFGAAECAPRCRGFGADRGRIRPRRSHRA